MMDATAVGAVADYWIRGYGTASETKQVEHKPSSGVSRDTEFKEWDIIISSVVAYVGDHVYSLSMIWLQQLHSNFLRFVGANATF
jgi:hypothetical protein